MGVSSDLNTVMGVVCLTLTAVVYAFLYLHYGAIHHYVNVA